MIVVEALHVSLQEAKSKGIFEGVNIGSDNVSISHLQFADDALIIGKWSFENAKNLCRILRCFHLAFGLKVNFSKSKLFGVGTTRVETNWLASSLYCQASSLPSIYLGLPIRANMNKVCNWKPIIDKFHNRLSTYKAKTLSYGGRFTLIKSVLDALAWKKVCSPSTLGGLGIDSLKASNLAMLTKWWWRFYTEPDALWHIWFKGRFRLDVITQNLMLLPPYMVQRAV
ncbi:putative RNA-directed DNA polymerase, eukaryota, reverse transcriptase zinc-binding domain protein [Tanacetum coccineum]